MPRLVLPGRPTLLVIARPDAAIAEDGPAAPPPTTSSRERGCNVGRSGGSPGALLFALLALLALLTVASGLWIRRRERT